MNAELVIARFNSLPENLQFLVADFIELLGSKYAQTFVAKKEVLESDEISPELKLLLDERIAEHERNPQDVVSWDEVKVQFNQKYGYAI